MAQFNLRFRAINYDIFRAILDGRKLIETRAATVKYLPINGGDTVIFSCKGETFERTVRSVVRFDTVDALLKKIDWREIFPDAKDAEEVHSSYKSFPGYEKKIKENGILAISLE